MKAVVKAKAAIVNDLKVQIDESSLVVVTDFRGLSVSDITDLRQEIRKSGASAKVIKNTLTRRAMSALEISYPEDMLVGPSMVVISKDDPVTPAKVLVKYAKSNENLKIKGGVIEKAVADANKITALAKLPSREELIAKAMGSMNAPATNLVGVLSNTVKSLAIVLNAIKNKQEEEQ